MVERKLHVPFGERAYDVVYLKATGAAKGGRFEAVVSVFDNIDSYLDRVRKGAFVDTLKSPAEGGRGFPPVVWSHLWGIVPIGASMRAEEAEGIETEKGKIDGLFIEGDLMVDEHQTAKEVYAAMRKKGGDGLPPLREFSFGYRVDSFNMVSETPTLEDGTEADPIEIRDLLKLWLYEVGPTLVGANDMTALLSVKAQRELTELIRKAAPLDKTATGEHDDDPETKTPPDVGTQPVQVVNEVLTTFPR